MGLFGSIFNSAKNPPAPPPNPALQARIAQEPPTHLVGGYPRDWQADLARLVDRTDLPAVLDRYQGLDTTGRFHFLEDFGDFFDVTEESGQRLWQAWTPLLERTQTPHAKLLLGIIHNQVAWHVRGGGTRNQLSDQQVSSFQQHLRTGLQLLVAAGHELNNSDIVPFLHAQNSATAVPQDIWEVAKTWQAIDPFNRHGLYRLGAQLDERWFGDSVQQLEFAEMIAHNAPDGHEGLAVVPELVQARWEYLRQFEGLERAECDAQTIELPPVREYLKLAYHKLFKTGHQVDPRVTVRHLSFFAWCFYWGNDEPLAYEIFRVLQGRAYEPVWGFRDPNTDPVFAYNQARDYLIEEIEFGGQR